MSKVSAPTVSFYQRTSASDVDKNSPEEALRRLNLKGDAGKTYSDVINLSSDDLQIVGRTLDAERENLQTDFEQAAEASGAMQKISDLLDEADQLAQQNQKAGLATIARRTNQKALDKVLDDIQDAIDNASTTNKELFAGNTTLTAANTTIKIPRVTLDELGKNITNGRSYSLHDLRKGDALDFARHPKHKIANISRDTIKQAKTDVTKMKKELEDFQVNVLKPRLGDVATALEAIYVKRGPTLTSTNDALNIAAEIRQEMLTSATFAAAVGSDGWDKDRILALITPSSSSSSK